MAKLILTDTEWMNIIDSTRKDLPVCCANISDFRDWLIEIARKGGEYVQGFDDVNLLNKWKHISENHGTGELVQKILDQLTSRSS